MEINKEVILSKISGFFIGFLPLLLFVLYCWALLNNLILWSSISLLLMVSFSAFLLIPAIRSKIKNYKSIFFVLAGIVTFGIIETVYSSLTFIPSLNIWHIGLQPSLQLLPSLYFMAALYFYLQHNIEQWHPAQIKLDFLVAAFLTFGSVIMVLFHSAKYPKTFAEFLIEANYLALFLITLMMTLLIAMLVSTRTKKLKFSTVLVFSAAVLYVTGGFFRISNAFMGISIPKELIEILYIISIILVSAAVYLAYGQLEVELQGSGDASYINEGRIAYTWWLLVPCAACVMICGLNYNTLAYFLVILLTYVLLSSYMQKNMATEHLLTESKRKNESLENYILEQKGRLKSINENVTYIAEHDKLTGLCNRDRFLQESGEIIARTLGGRRLYLIIVDIDRFRLVNESYGNEVGDEVLKRMAERINSVFNDKFSCVARLDGNEFAILCYGFKEFSQVLHKINQLLFISKAPMNITPFQIPVNIHVGVATYPENAKNKTDLLKCAKIAVEQSKIMKMDVCSTYNSTLYEQEHRKLEIEYALRKADIKKEFEVYYQPQYDVSGKELLGMEALLRWKSPSVGLICPAEFIPIAEETGLILEIGGWVMEAAMKQIIKWNMEYGTEFCVSINVSAIQIQNTNFIYNVRNLINRYKVNTSWLNFEITESSAMKSIETYQEVLNELTDMGISVSIDDFGTGYSSYIYLKRATIDYLKIDKQLIDMISTIASDAQIVNAIISMAQSLEIKTIAEGVESKEQLELLNGMGCDIIQGYFYGEPMPADEFLENHLQKHTNEMTCDKIDCYRLDSKTEQKMA